MEGLENPIVLHVEDDDGDAYLVVRALAQSPCNVRIGRASDGKEAINRLNDAVEGRSEMPALIILDWKLPVISGLDVLKHIRSQPQLVGIPTVVFTSSDVSSDRDAAEEAGCTEYFVKPIEYTQFKATVHEICQKYLASSGVAMSEGRAFVV